MKSTEPTKASRKKKSTKHARPSASFDDSDPDYLDSQVLSKTPLTDPAATSSQKGEKTKKRARPSASVDDSDLDYLDSQVLSDDSDPDYLDSQVLSKTILSEPAVQSTPVSERAVQSTPVSVPAPVPPEIQGLCVCSSRGTCFKRNSANKH